VRSRRFVRIRRRQFLNPWPTTHRLPPPPHGKPAGHPMDFSRGPAEMAASLREQRACRLSPEFSLHVNEMALAIHGARTNGATVQMTTRFDPMEPMPWAA
jgi:hypothetical protein